MQSIYFVLFFQIASAAHILHLPDTKDSKTPPKQSQVIGSDGVPLANLQ